MNSLNLELVTCLILLPLLVQTAPIQEPGPTTDYVTSAAQLVELAAGLTVVGAPHLAHIAVPVGAYVLECQILLFNLQQNYLECS